MQFYATKNLESFRKRPISTLFNVHTYLEEYYLLLALITTNIIYVQVMNKINTQVTRRKNGYS